MPNKPVPTATVVIATKNRKDDLERAVRSAVAQTPPVEVLVLDDGSDDGSAEMVRALFPSVRLERYDTSEGYIVRRNIGAQMAAAPIIFTIDDDAEFSTPEIVSQILPSFRDERVGAVAIPFMEPNKTGDQLFQMPPTPTSGWTTYSYIGTSHALRRDLFLQMGSYRESLVHQGEEQDYCIRLIDAGYRVELGISDPILHYESPKRDHRRMDYYGTRNVLLFAWQNVPMPEVFPLVLGSTVKTLLYTLVWSRLTVRMRAAVDAYRLFRTTERDPVSRETYRTFRRLKTKGPDRA